MLFSDRKEHAVSLPSTLNDGTRPTVDYLVQHLCEKVMKDDRKELFVQDGTVCVYSIYGYQLKAIVADSAQATWDPCAYQRR